jgi:hypothetical protein
MSIASLFQSAGRLLNDLASQVSPDTSQSQASATTTTQSTGKLSVIPTTATGDHFTPSQQSAVSNTAGDAGLFEIQQSRLTPTQSAAVGVQQPAATLQSAAQNATTSAATAPATPAATPVTSGDNNASTNTAISNPDSPQSQQALQSLNSSLAGLGLTAAEIAAFDQYAAVLLQFDPNALQDLQSQLNLLATQYATNGGGNAAATQSAAASPASASAAAPAATAVPAANSGNITAATATTASAIPLLNPAQSSAAATNNPPNFQLSAFSITFGPSASAQSANTQTTPAIGLTILEASVSLNAPSGHTVQLQSPSPSTLAAAKSAAA